MEKRLCEECKEIEDEVHYLLYCKKYQNECETLMKKLSSSCDLSSLSDKEKLKILLCSSDTVLKAIAVFMSHSLINNFSHVCMYIYIYICICYVMMKPGLHDLEEKFCDSGVVVIGVHSSKFPNEKGSENILNAILRYNITHPVVNDANIELWERLNVSCWPTLVLIGPNQQLLYYIIGEGHMQELNLVVETCVSFYKEKNQLNIDTIGIALEKHKSAISGLYFPGKIIYNPLKKQLYISDSSNHRILVVNRDTGLVVRTFGSGKPGLKDGVEKEAEFNTPQGMSYYEESLYVADTENHSIRKVN